MPKNTTKQLLGALKEFYDVWPMRSDSPNTGFSLSQRYDDSIDFAFGNIVSLKDTRAAVRMLKDDFGLKLREPIERNNHLGYISAGEMSLQEIDFSIEKIQRAMCKIKGERFEDFIETRDQAQFQKSIKSYTQRLKDEIQDFAAKERGGR